MTLLSVVLVAVGLFLYSLISGRLQGGLVTAPLVFIGFGVLLGDSGSGVAEFDLEADVIHLIAESTLILILFSDASRIKLGDVRRDHDLPQRMLMIGLPLTIALGTLAGYYLLPGFSFWEAALLAALLAPTDAALGQSVVTAEAVPTRIRQAINIESGLNDGIALPAVLLFASLAEGAHGAEASAFSWAQFVLFQLGFGPLVGILVGLLGAAALDRAKSRDWLGEDYQGVAILSLAASTFVIAELVGGNGFIAVFVGGMVFGNRLRHANSFLFRFMETEGQLLMLLTFLIFGAVMLPRGIEAMELHYLVYALCSLTVIRVLPVLISLLGAGVSLQTQLFLGWFGPRGLASVLFLLLILEETDLPGSESVFTVTVLTVALSALLHGVTAAPLAAWYGRLAAGLESGKENRPAVELPLRRGHITVKKLE